MPVAARRRRLIQWCAPSTRSEAPRRPSDGPRIEQPHPRLIVTVRTTDTASRWLGDWSPTIGDPTAIGWATVVAYVAGAAACVAAWRRERSGDAPDPAVARTWLLLGILLGALGLNKQLDLQSALTAIGRSLAVRQGWYEHRRAVQLVFICVVLAIGALLARGAMRAALGSLRPMRGALVGFTLLVLFVGVRASSFHHVDVLIGRSVGGVTLNGALELGGIATILVSALRYRPVGHAQGPGWGADE